LHLINDYIKDSKYGKQNPMNLEEINSFDFLFQAFEEFIEYG
jgi:hypothetical protein